MTHKPIEKYQKLSLLISAILGIFLNFVHIISILIDSGHDEKALHYKVMIHYPVLDLFFHIFTSILIGYLLFLLNFLLLNHRRHEEKFWGVIQRTFLTILSAALLTFALINAHSFSFGIEGRMLHGLYGMYIGRSLLLTIIILFTTQILYLLHKQQETRLENQKLIAENIRTQFEALKNQVDPHFLFNSLNTLNSLIATNAEKAQEYVQQLASVFRYTLQNKDLVSLAEELKFAQSFGHLMQIRYGEHLFIDFKIDKRLENLMVVPFSIQLLIENAIKHNVINKKQPLTITVETISDKKLVVQNPIQSKREEEDSEGIGLANLNERCKLLMQKEVIISSDTNIFRVEVPISKTQLKMES
jgi:two-component system, LytTR family, sensor kinase